MLGGDGGNDGEGDEGGIVVCYGTECFDDLIENPIGTAERTYWREEPIADQNNGGVILE